MSRYRKAIVAIVGALIVLLDGFGIDVPKDTLDPVVAFVTAAVVFLTPNSG